MIVGILRVKNESRWIARCVGSILPICDQVIVLDDLSDDETPKICNSMPNVTVFHSPFSGLDEARDKNWLLDKAMVLNPRWIVHIDGDEMLAPGYEGQLREEMKSAVSCLSLRILYLWNDEQHVRMDGVYNDFHRESVFRPNGARFEATSAGANFHCGNVPMDNRRARKVTKIPLLHFGYIDRELRIKKYAWYNAIDRDNEVEDRYRHMVIGDVFPAESKFAHAGPLQLRAL